MSSHQPADAGHCWSSGARPSTLLEIETLALLDTQRNGVYAPGRFPSCRPHEVGDDPAQLACDDAEQTASLRDSIPSASTVSASATLFAIGER